MSDNKISTSQNGKNPSSEVIRPTCNPTRSPDQNRGYQPKYNPPDSRPPHGSGSSDA